MSAADSLRLVDLKRGSVANLLLDHIDNRFSYMNIVRRSNDMVATHTMRTKAVRLMNQATMMLTSTMDQLKNWFGKKGFPVDKDWLPFEHRPVFVYHNISINTQKLPTGYTTEFSQESITLIFTDKIIEYRFNDLEKRKIEIEKLDKEGIRRIFFDKHAIIVALIMLTAVAIAFALT